MLKFLLKILREGFWVGGVLQQEKILAALAKDRVSKPSTYVNPLMTVSPALGI